jgi:hypothetical protein
MKPFNGSFYPCLYLCLCLWLTLAACTSMTNSAPPIADSTPDPSLPDPSLKAIAFDPNQIVMGQTVYVPIYSHIFHHNSRDRPINLSATVSIGNTDSKNPIIIKSVSYYDTQGQLIKQYLQKPVELNPMATTSFFVEADDVTGGAGANFIVEWGAQKAVTEPVIEAVMISTASGQGISFISEGRVLNRYGIKK